MSGPHAPPGGGDMDTTNIVDTRNEKMSPTTQFKARRFPAQRTISLQHHQPQRRMPSPTTGSLGGGGGGGISGGGVGVGMSISNASSAGVVASAAANTSAAAASPTGGFVTLVRSPNASNNAVAGFPVSSGGGGSGSSSHVRGRSGESLAELTNLSPTSHAISGFPTLMRSSGSMNALLGSPALSRGSPASALAAADQRVSVFFPQRASDGDMLRGVGGTGGEDNANDDRVQVRVDGYFDSDTGVLIPNELPKSTLLYVLTASDGRDLMFKTVQYSLQLLICVLKTPSLFSPESAPFLDRWALRLWRNYNTIRHGRSLFKMGRGILNLFTLQTVCERMWVRYKDRVERQLEPLLTLLSFAIEPLWHVGEFLGLPGCGHSSGRQRLLKMFPGEVAAASVGEGPTPEDSKASSPVTNMGTASEGSGADSNNNNNRESGLGAYLRRRLWLSSTVTPSRSSRGSPTTATSPNTVNVPSRRYRDATGGAAATKDRNGSRRRTRRAEITAADTLIDDDTFMHVSRVERQPGAVVSPTQRVPMTSAAPPLLVRETNRQRAAGAAAATAVAYGRSPRLPSSPVPEEVSASVSPAPFYVKGEFGMSLAAGLASGAVSSAGSRSPPNAVFGQRGVPLAGTAAAAAAVGTISAPGSPSAISQTSHTRALLASMGGYDTSIYSLSQHLHQRQHHQEGEGFLTPDTIGRPAGFNASSPTVPPSPSMTFANASTKSDSGTADAATGLRREGSSFADESGDPPTLPETLPQSAFGMGNGGMPNIFSSKGKTDGLDVDGHEGGMSEGINYSGGGNGSNTGAADASYSGRSHTLLKPLRDAVEAADADTPPALPAAKENSTASPLQSAAQLLRRKRDGGRHSVVHTVAPSAGYFGSGKSVPFQDKLGEQLQRMNMNTSSPQTTAHSEDENLQTPLGRSRKGGCSDGCNTSRRRSGGTSSHSRARMPSKSDSQAATLASSSTCGEVDGGFASWADGDGGSPRPSKPEEDDAPDMEATKAFYAAYCADDGDIDDALRSVKDEEAADAEASVRSLNRRRSCGDGGATSGAQYNDSDVSLDSSSNDRSGGDGGDPTSPFAYRNDELEPAVSAEPSRWRKGPMDFSPLLMTLVGVRNLVAGTRRFMRDLTLVSSERFFTFDYVERNRVTIHRRINYMWLVVSIVDVLLNTIRLARPGWAAYVTARQNALCRCGCRGSDDPDDLVWRSNGLITRQKKDLFFPPLDLDYGAPYASNIAYVEAADPIHMRPGCHRCGYLYKEVSNYTNVHQPEAEKPRWLQLYDAEVSMKRAAGNAREMAVTNTTITVSRGNAASMGSAPNANRTGSGSNSAYAGLRLRSPCMEVDKGCVVPFTVTATVKPSLLTVERVAVPERNAAVAPTVGADNALAADARLGERVVQRRALGFLSNSPAAGNGGKVTITGNSSSPAVATGESSMGFLLLPFLMRKLFDYVWLLRVHPNLTSALLLQLRYLAELFLAYKYCFGNYEPSRTDAPLYQILNPGGAVAGLISAAVGLLRVVESAPK